MIERIQAFKVGDQTYPTIEQAQERALLDMLGEVPGDPQVKAGCVGRLVKDFQRAIDILTTTPRSLPKARKINGGKKTKKVGPTPTV